MHRTADVAPGKVYGIFRDLSTIGFRPKAWLRAAPRRADYVGRLAIDLKRHGRLTRFRVSGSATIRRHSSLTSAETQWNERAARRLLDRHGATSTTSWSQSFRRGEPSVPDAAEMRNHGSAYAPCRLSHRPQPARQRATTELALCRLSSRASTTCAERSRRTSEMCRG